MNFDFNNISLVTFYGFFDDASTLNPRHIQIPIHPQVQSELKRMLTETMRKLGLPASEATMQLFDPAQKYSSEEQLKIPLATPYLQDLTTVLALANLPSDANALSFINQLEYYYAIFTDNSGRKLYAFRRASQFKGVTKSKLALVNGGVLTLLSGQIFRLDNDFDYLVTDLTVFVLRPAGFEFTTNVGGQILHSSIANSQSIGAAISYLDMTNIASYASTHSRSARLLAAIKARNDLNLIDRSSLVNACLNYGIAILNPITGQLSPDAGHEYDFLCILDRRAYTTTLIPNSPENYEAANRVQK